MANILAQSSQRKIDVQPVGYNQCCNMIVRSNVVSRQTYDNVTGLYTPDYKDAPLIIFPECQLIDPDSPISSVKINSELSSFRWLEVTATGETELASQSGNAKDGYEIIQSGESKGQITVKKNSIIGVRRTLRFIGTWIDTVSGYVYRFSKDIPLVIEDVTDARASITLDMPNTDKWNPFRQEETRTINALVMIGTHDFTESAKVKIFWYRVMDDGTKKLVNDIDDEDNWEIVSVKKGSNGQIVAITVNRDMIGDRISYEVRCAYRTDGNLPSEPEAGDPIATTTLVRCFPQITAQFTGSNARVQGTETSIRLKAIVSDTQGEIPQWEDIAYAAWYLCTSSDTRTLLGTGSEITVETDKAKFIQLDICDRGATVAFVDDDGNYLIDGDSLITSKPIV